MGLAFNSNERQEYATKTEAIHLIDGKIQINVEEAREALKKRTKPADLF